jgi:hypothetical protein
MIEPILLYGSEVWGYENLKILEQIHLKFCKRILKVRNTTPNFIVYGIINPLEIILTLIFKHNINLYKELLNFVSLFTSLHQYEIIRSFTRIDFGLENYLVRLNEKTRIWMTKLRASNLRIPIETGRWYNIPNRCKRRKGGGRGRVTYKYGVEANLCWMLNIWR